LLAALGGKANLVSVAARSTRLLIEVRDATAVDESKVAAAGYRGATRASDRGWHVVVGPAAAAVARSMQP
jgi:PTS system N-acetylglucosamine-specific IIC component